MKYLLTSIILCLAVTALFAQYRDCSMPFQICATSTLALNSTGSGEDDFANPNNSPGCLLFEEHESSWLVIKIAPNTPPNSTLSFTITPFNPTADYDFAVYGPAANCDNLGEPIRCSYASNSNANCEFCPQTGLGMGATDNSEGATGNSFVAELEVLPNQIYYILLDNFEADASGVDFRWTGTAELDCDLSCLAQAGNYDVPVIASNQSTNFPSDENNNHYILCDGDEIEVFSNQNYTLPSAANGENSTLLWAVYNSEPPVLPSPDDANFTGILVDSENISETNSGGNGIYANGNQTVWLVPVVGDDAEGGNNGTIGIDSNNDECLAYGQPLQITFLQPIEVEISNSCSGPMITATGGHAAFFNSNFSISNLQPANALPSNFNPANGQSFSINNLNQGDSYSFILTDENGCSIEVSGVFDAGDARPDAIVGTEGEVCEGEDFTLTGSTTAIGTNISYEWTSDNGFSSNEQNPVVSPGVEGNYLLVVTVDGCASAPTLITVGLEQPPILDPIPAQNTCATDFDLTSLEITGSNLDNANFNFYQDNNGEPETVINSVVTNSGTYWVEAYIGTPPATCGSFQAVEISIGDVTISEVEVQSLSCPDNNDGSISVTIEGGLPPYQLQWSNGATDTELSNLTAGNYMLNVTDANGCFTSMNFEIPIPEALQTNIIQQIPPTCFGLTDGIIEVNTMGGTPPYNYQWNNSETTNLIENLDAGNYSLTITDANNCQEIIPNIHLEAPIELIADFMSTPSNCDTPTGSIEINVFGGTGNISYQWAHDFNLYGPIVQNLAAGNYNVTVSDENDCSFIISPYLPPKEAPILSVVDSLLPTCNNENGSIVVGATGTSSNLTYTWVHDVFLDQNAANNLSSGNYQVSVQDENGCIDSLSVSLSDIDGPMLTLENAITPDCENLGSISFSASGGMGNLAFSWSHDASLSTTSATDLTGGSYQITAEDENACQAFLNVDLPATPIPEILLENLQNASCGEPNGSISIGVNNPVAGLIYTWSHDENAPYPHLTNLEAGAYTVTVSYENGCSTIETFEITGSPGLELVLENINSADCMNGSTSLTVGVNNGQPPFTYQWSHNLNLNEATATNLGVGTYSLSVTDATGCSAVYSHHISEAVLPMAVLDSLKPELCEAQNGAIFLSQVPQAVYRINCGQTSSTNIGPNGTLFLEDNYFSGGNNSGYYPPAISNEKLADHDFYGEWRFAQDSFSYAFPIENGEYIVNLYFVEVDFQDGNTSYVDATIEGVQVLDDFWIKGEYGVRVGDFESFNTTVADGMLNIHFGGFHPLICAIEVLPVQQPVYNWFWSHDANLNTPNAENLATGNYTVSIADASGCENVFDFEVGNVDSLVALPNVRFGYQDCAANTGNVLIEPQKQALWRINCGGAAFTTADKHHFIADRFNILGEVTSTNNPIANTNNDFLYQSNRQGDIRYEIPVPNGKYQVLLHFSENNETAPNDQAFNADIENVNVLANFNIKNETGNENTAIIKTLNTTVSDGFLSLFLYEINFVASLCAIEVLPISEPLEFSYTWPHDANLTTNFVDSLPIDDYTVLVATQYGCEAAFSIQMPDFPETTFVIDTIIPTRCDSPTGSIALSASTNLIQNGDFSAGNTGFYSNYTLLENGMMNTGQYQITNVPNALNSSFLNCNDHSGDGFMLVADGNIFPEVGLWCTELEVQPNRTYTLSFWATGAGEQAAFPRLQFYINGNPVSSEFLINSSPCDWQNFSTQWTANTDYIELCIVNQNLGGGGNDVLIDDIEFFTTEINSVNWSHDMDLENTLANNLEAADYQITITDVLGCSFDTIATVPLPEPPIISIQNLELSGCNDDHIGSISISGEPLYRINCGSGNYTGMLTGNVFGGDAFVTGGAVFNHTNLIQKTVDVPLYQSNRQGDVLYEFPLADTLVEVFLHFAEPTVTDRRFDIIAENNTIFSNYNIFANAGGINQAVIEKMKVLVTDGVLSLQLTGTNGSPLIAAIEVYAVPENPLFSWSHNDAISTAFAENLARGEYEISMTDDWGCTNSISLDLPGATEPELSLLEVIEPALCLGIFGTAEITTNDPNITFSWSHNPNLNDAVADDLVQGDYFVIGDLNGCKDTLHFYVDDPTVPDIALENMVGTTCVGDDGSIQISVTGGVGSYTYAWSHQPDLDTALVQNLMAGDYTVTVTDKNGCVGEADFSLELFAPELELAEVIPSDCNVSIGSISVADIGQSVLPISYSWSHNANLNDSLATQLSGGTYEVIVTDANGCTDTLSAAIPNTDGPFISDVLIQNPDSCGQATGLAIIQTEGNSNGADAIDYQWSHDNNLNDSIANNLAVGMYAVTLTDALGCQNETDFEIIAPPSPILTLGNLQPETCEDSNGEATIFVSGSSSPFNYIWSHTDSINGNSVNQLTAGNYSVSVTDSRLCSAEIELQIEGIHSPVVSSLEVTPTDCEVNTGSILVTIESNADSLIFDWSHDENADSTLVENLGAGTYDLAVLDEVGCSVFASFNIQTTQDSINTVQNEILCKGANFEYEGQVYEADTTVITSTPSLNGCAQVHTLNLQFLPPDTTILQELSCRIAETGVFEQTLENQFECDSLVILNIDFLAMDTTFENSFSCNPNLAGVFVENHSAEDGCDSTIVRTIDFVPLDTTFVQSVTCNLNQSGLFTNNIPTVEGCDSIVISMVEFIPLDTTFLDFTTCNQNEAGLFTDHLSTPEGCDSIVLRNIAFIPLDTSFLFNNTCNPNEAGYFVNTIITVEGCDSIVINDVALLRSDTTLLANTTCNENEAGVFTQNLNNAVGCDSTVIHTITFIDVDTTVLHSQTCLEDRSGIFLTEMLTNVHGCDSLVFQNIELIENTLDIEIADMALYLGDSIPIPVQTNFTPDSIRWTPSDGLSCDNCLSPFISTFDTKEYQVWMSAGNDCETSTHFTVFVDQTGRIYVPNAFSPDDDGVNDVFMIFSDNSVEEVLAFRVFDRWGNLMFEDSHFQPNEEGHGWDGRFENREVNGGVFTWLAVVQLVNGVEKVLRGDVVLMR